MKSALLFTALALSYITYVFGTAATLKGTIAAVPQAHEIEPSVDPSPNAPGSAKFINDAANTQYWVCIAISLSTGKYGWSQGGSESSALRTAKSKCGNGDCHNHWVCQERGCVGIDYGRGYVALSYASGYGSSDGSKAGNKALSTCEAHTSGCGRPGHFCSKYVV